MGDLVNAVSVLRDGAVAILRIHLERPEVVKKGKVLPGKVGCSFGSGFCVSPNKYVLTAHHVLNGGKPRDPQDMFYVFTVPGNGDSAFHFPVTGFPLEHQGLDFAVLEIGPCATEGVELPALMVSFGAVSDGASVVTVGYPAPEIINIKVDQELNYNGGQFFLKSHANEGIVAAQYMLDSNRIYELNVGWHHGESGGPIAVVEPEPKVFSVMQHYRDVQSPHGVVAGPHRGFALAAIEAELAALGISGM